MTVQVFGVRHHGPGSARSLRSALERLKPDCILIEGPPEANKIVPLIAEEGMAPPVALLVYSPEDTAKAVYYPFAVFSPEWQAMSIGVKSNVPVRFMDLPQTHWLALKDDEDSEPADESEDEAGDIRRDPLTALAQAAGFADGERWWEHMVEHRRDGTDLFKAITEAMTTLREELPGRDEKIEQRREAHMRQTIRAAQKEGFENIAVVCGAWHAPVMLQNGTSAKQDTELLKGLPKVKVESTWIPWTHSRLSYATGYGAGVTSPGWYHHLWTHHDRVIERWMALVARLLRAEDLDASSAHIIEAVRLAESLAALRGRHLPGLTELTEATQSVLCFGNDIPLRLIHDKLIVGHVLGTVPEATPSVPLQIDLQKEQKRLRFPATDEVKVHDLDLRKEIDLDRSRLLHRLNLLGMSWGQQQKSTGKGTFRELWEVRWAPDFSLRLIEAGRWGKTVAEAAAAYTCDAAQNLDELPDLTHLLDRALLADIGQAAEIVMQRVESVAATASDVTHLMHAIPPLVQVARYGNVRKTDASAVEKIIAGLISRVCISLPGACSAINDDAAAPMFERVGNIHSAIQLLQFEEHTQLWLETLLKLADSPGIHGLVAGRACRLLLEQRAIDAPEAARRLGLALSAATGPVEAANWAEGFLRGSGLVLIHDEALWGIVDEWVCSLAGDHFTEILPLLRRTFSTFPSPERRQMGERVSGGAQKPKKTAAAAGQVDSARGDLVLPVVAQILGME